MAEQRGKHSRSGLEGWIRRLLIKLRTVKDEFMVYKDAEIRKEIQYSEINFQNFGSVGSSEPELRTYKSFDVIG